MGESRPIDELGTLLSTLVDRHGLTRARWLTIINSLWRTVVGEAIAAHTSVLTLTTDGTLIVAVPSSVWSQEILYYKPALLHAIQDALPDATIKDIRTRVKAAPPVQSAAPDGLRVSPYFRTDGRTLDLSRDLGALLAEVQEKYEAAAREWLHDGCHPCVRCQAPTLDGYALCVVCEWDKRRTT